MTERPAEAAIAAESTSLNFPPNPFIDTDSSHPVMAISETLGRVVNVIEMLDCLDWRDDMNNSQAAGVHWVMEACVGALESCKQRLKAEVRRNG